MGLLDGLLSKYLTPLRDGQFHKWEYLAGINFDILRKALHEAVDSNQLVTSETQLQQCWHVLTDERIRDQIDAYYYDKRGHHKADVDIDIGRLHRHAVGLLATAGAALTARMYCKRNFAEEDFALFRQWIGRSLQWLASTPIPGYIPVPGKETDPVNLINNTFSRLAWQEGLPVACARVWTLHWLQSIPPSYELKIPVALVNEVSTGSLVFLNLIKQEYRELFEHPDRALYPLGQTFLKTLKSAWESTGGTQGGVCWKLLSNDWRPLDGDSVGGAAAVGFRLLQEERPYDPGCLIAARVGQDLFSDPAKLDKVAGEESKLNAALNRGIRTAVLAKNSYLTATQDEEFRDKGLAIQRADTVDRAMEIASGLASRMLQYFDWVIAWPGRDLPVYLAGRKRSDLYIWPEIFRPEPASAAPPDLHAGGEGPWTGSIGQSKKIVAGKTTEVRLSWRDELENLDRSSRVVIVAYPGQGKTMLTRMSARELAIKAQTDLRKQDKGAFAVPLPVVITLGALEKAWIAQKKVDADPRRAICQVLKEDELPVAQKSFLTEMSRHLDEERTWLFLDGLDEWINHAAFFSFLEAIKDWACNVVITSRPYGFDQHRFPFPVVHYRILPLTIDQGKQFIAFWCGQQTRLLPFLEKTFDVATASETEVIQNPFLLTLFARNLETAVEGGRASHQLLNRTRIYQDVLNDLLGRCPKNPGAVDYTRAEFLRPVLAELAFQVFMKQPGNPQIPAGRVAEHLAENHNRLYEKPQEVLEDLIEQGILVPRTPARASYSFPHATFHEFLAANYLADMIMKDDWEEATLKIKGKKQPVLVSTLINAKAWLPEWQEALVFLAGLLTDPRPLLNLLESGPDDYFYHRSALAARCLPEIPSEKLFALSDTVDSIAVTVLILWYEALQRGVTAAYSHLDGALAALAWVDALVDGKPFLHWLGDLVEANDMRAIDLMRRIGPAAGKSRFLDRLGSLLQHPEERVRWLAIRSLRMIGAAAGRKRVVFPLMKHLVTDPEPSVRDEAALALGMLGRNANIPELLDFLSNLLKSSKKESREAALKIVEGLGSKAARNDVLQALADLLLPDSLANCRPVLEMGQAAATEEFLDRVARSLQEPGKKSKIGGALVGLGLGGEAARRPEILEGVLQFLEKGGPPVHVVAARIRYRASRLDFWEAVAPAEMERCRDRLGLKKLATDANSRETLMWIITILGPHSGNKQILPTLTEALRDSSPRIRQAALHAVEALSGTVGQDPGVLQAVIELLGDPDAEVRFVTLETLQHLLEPISNNPGLLEQLPGRLIPLLEDSEFGLVPVFAAQLLSHFVKSFSPAQLLPLLMKGNNDVTWRAEAGMLKAGGLVPLLLQEKNDVTWKSEILILSRLAEQDQALRTRLFEWLQSENGGLRAVALGTLRNLDLDTVSDSVLENLLTFLHHSGTPYSPFYREAAADILGRFMAAGNRVFLIDQKNWQAKKVEELAVLDAK